MNVNSHIRYKKIALTELEFELNKKFKPSAKGINVVMDLSVKIDFAKSKMLVCALTAEFFKDATKNGSAPFYLRATVEGHFESDDAEELKNFSSVNAPAHLLPFLREVIANTTMRASVPPLFIPPLNVKHILDTINSKTKSIKQN